MTSISWKLKPQSDKRKIQLLDPFPHPHFQTHTDNWRHFTRYPKIIYWVCSKSKQKIIQGDFTALWWLIKHTHKKFALSWLIIKRTPKWTGAASLGLGTFSSHFWFFTSESEWPQSHPSFTGQRWQSLFSCKFWGGRLPSLPRKEFLGSWALQRQGWEQMGNSWLRSLCHKSFFPWEFNSCNTSSKCCFHFRFPKMMAKSKKETSCFLVQGCLHKTPAISDSCCMKNQNLSSISYNSLEFCFQELLRQALEDTNIQGKHILAGQRNVVFF